MTYLNCPQCGLSVPAHDHQAGNRAKGSQSDLPGRDDPDGLIPCPRCLGRADLVVPMYETDRLRPPAEIRAPLPQAA